MCIYECVCVCVHTHPDDPAWPANMLEFIFI